MKHLFSALAGQRERRRAALALGLLAGAASPAFAQQVPATPTTVYGLGYNVNSQATFIVALNPANLTGPNSLFQTPSGGFSAAIPVGTAGVLPAGQRLVGIDARPSTGQLFALGYDYTKTTNNARLYALTLNAAGTSYTVAPVGTALLTLDLQDPSKGAFVSPPTANTLDFSTTPTPTAPQLYNVVFDFNPRADRIRVSAPRSSSGTSGITYVLNPNTGTSTAASPITGSYLDGNGQAVPYYVGTGAYTNSTFGVAGTTLYDLGINNTRGSVLTQNISTGALTEQAALTFATQTNATNYDPLYSPTTRVDLDFYYDRGSSNAQKNIGYVLESRRNNGNTGYSSNLYTLDFSTGNATSGRASGKNIYGAGDGTSGGASFIYDIAVLSSSPKIWIGKSTSAPTAWNDAANWYPTGAPTSGDDVLIPGNGTFVAFGGGYTITTQPVVSTTSTTAPNQALSVTLTNGALLTTADGGTLNVYGDFVNTDSQVAGSGTGTVALVGGTAQDISGNTVTNFQNLSVGTGTTATTSAGVSITRSLTASGNLAIGSGQPFTLLSSASGTAYLVNNNGSLVTGVATVQRYITPTNAGAGYRHYSSPVSGNTVADFATSGYSPVVNAAYNSANNPGQTTPYPTVFYYNQSRLATSNATYTVGDFDNGFLSPNALSDALVTAQGYTVNIGGTELVDFQGALNQNASYARTGLTRGAQTRAGYQLLGNPYPSALNYESLITNTVGMESALYVYKSSGQYTGTYTTYVPSGATNGGPGVSANGGTSNIPVAQGFFMRTAAGQTGSVTFTTAARTTAPETAAFQRTAADSHPTLALTLRNTSIANQTRVYFDQQATPAFDARYDAHYLPATHGLDLASDISTEALAINGLPELTGATTVALRVHAPAAGTYTLAVDELANLPAGYRAYLRDASTGTYTDLSTTPSVSLTLSPTDPATGRYAVVFSATAPLATASAALSAQAGLYPSPAHGTATLLLPLALRGNSASTVQVLNTLGQVVLTKTVAAGTAPTIELPLTGLAAGIYTVQASTAAGLIAKRLVVQ